MKKFDKIFFMLICITYRTFLNVILCFKKLENFRNPEKLRIFSKVYGENSRSWSQRRNLVEKLVVLNEYKNFRCTTKHFFNIQYCTVPVLLLI
jgi:hypothetical protein